MKNYSRTIASGPAAAALFCFILIPLPAENSGSLFKRIDLFTSASLRVPFDKIRDETESFTLYRESADGSGGAGWNCRNIEDAVKLCSLGTTAGMRVSFRDCDIRLYDTLPATAFAVMDEASSPEDFRALLNAPQYGASFMPARFLHFPLVLQTGTLTPGGSWTRLSSPELSASVSPFTKSFSTKQGVSSSLPGASSGEKPPAGALSAGVPETCSLLKGSGFSCFYRKDGTYAASALFSFNFPRMIRTSLSFTGGRFFLSNASSSWFSDTAFFRAGWFSAFSGQALYSSPSFSSLFTVNAYEQPSAEIRYTFRSENKVTAGRFTLLFAGFAADGKDIRCTDNSLLTTLGQLRVTPQYTWRFASPRLPSLTAGASCLVQHKYDRSTRSEFNDIKCTIGTKYADRQIAAGLTFSAAGFRFSGASSSEYGEPEYTVSARFSETKGYFRAAASTACTFSDSSAEESLKVTLGTQNKRVSISGTAAASCRQKNSEYEDGTASLAFTCSFLSKLLKYTARLTLLGSF